MSQEERNNPEFVWEYRHRRTSLQAAELTVAGECLECERGFVEMDLG